ncbi:MAG: tetratricopeptide repeat protein [Myxococcales bacterium]|nr:tetratricopeptide repeat protein [Myxococcales bacterium]
MLRDDEKNVDAMINLAAAYHHDGRHELAIAILDNARALRPDDPEILARKALAHRALGEDQRARFALEEATALPGGATAEVHNNLGLIYHAAGDYPGAEAQFRRALARWPGMLAATINLANALKGQQRFAEADAALQQALARAPRDPDVLYNLGILYLDGQLPDLAPADRLGRALAFFERYQQTATHRAADDPAAEYIEEARKRIEVERKRAEQQRTAPKRRRRPIRRLRPPPPPDHRRPAAAPEPPTKTKSDPHASPSPRSSSPRPPPPSPRPRRCCHPDRRRPAAAAPAPAAARRARRATAAATAPARLGRRDPRVIEIDDVVVQGEVQRPEAFYVLQRSELDFKGQEPRRSFIPLIIQSVEEEPFR